MYYAQLRAFHAVAQHGGFTKAAERRYPAVTLAVTIGNSAEVMERLADYRADIGVLANTPDDARFRTVILRDDPLVAVVPADHGFATAAEVPFERLMGENLVLREVGSTTRRLVEDEFRRRGVPLPAVIAVEGRESVREAVAAGIGIGFVSEAEFGFDARLAMVRIADCDLRMREYMVALEARLRTRAVAAFWAEAETLGVDTGKAA